LVVFKYVYKNNLVSIEMDSSTPRHVRVNSMKSVPIQAIENVRLAHTWETWATLSSSERTRLIYDEIKRLDLLRVGTEYPEKNETEHPATGRDRPDGRTGSSGRPDFQKFRWCLRIAGAIHTKLCSRIATARFHPPSGSYLRD